MVLGTELRFSGRAANTLNGEPLLQPLLCVSKTRQAAQHAYRNTSFPLGFVFGSTPELAVSSVNSFCLSLLSDFLHLIVALFDILAADRLCSAAPLFISELS